MAQRMTTAHLAAIPPKRGVVAFRDYRPGPLVSLAQEDRFVEKLLFVAIVPLPSLIVLATPIVVTFLCCGLAAIALRPWRTARAAWAGWPVLVLPLLGLLSVVWSLEPERTFRSGLQQLITVLIGFAVVAAMRPRKIVLLSFLGLALAVLLSLGAPTRWDGIPVGIFGSKNNFAAAHAGAMLSALAVLCDRVQPRVWRLFAAVLMPLLVVQIGRAQSLGTVLAIAPAVLIFGAVLISARVPAGVRVALTLAAAALVAISVPVLIVASGLSQEEALIGLGKESTMTGRTIIAERGWQIVAERPWLGVGLEAFWVRGNLDAEALWRIGRVPPGPGFNFHNEYLQRAVDLGYVGMVIFCIFFAALGVRTLLWALRDPSPVSASFLALYSFMLPRTMVELSMFGQFSLVTVMLAPMWLLARRRQFVTDQPHEPIASGVHATVQ